MGGAGQVDGGRGDGDGEGGVEEVAGDGHYEQNTGLLDPEGGDHAEGPANYLEREISTINGAEEARPRQGTSLLSRVRNAKVDAITRRGVAGVDDEPQTRGHMLQAGSKGTLRLLLEGQMSHPRARRAHTRKRMTSPHFYK